MAGLSWSPAPTPPGRVFKSSALPVCAARSTRHALGCSPSPEGQVNTTPSLPSGLQETIDRSHAALKVKTTVGSALAGSD